MNELLVASNSPLLETVRQVNGMTKASETIPIYSEVAIIIPTSHGIDFLRRSLNSLANQTYMPKKAVVVSDQSNPNNSEISELVASYKNRLGIDHIMNTHAQNVSGAINSGLEHLDRGNYLDNNMFVGLLDDDDWWEPRYLENCVKFSYEYESDWIVPGLIRYDEKNPLGSKQPIPHVLSVSDFLVGNPNVQGSNLFVRAKNFKEVGRYDETLPSTTDRDICLRLLQKGTKYTILFNHLVHHDAFARSDRLSQPGSNRKREGLKAFYEKYSELMNGEQKAIFKARAKELFQIDLPEEGV
jgi:GT2 family glycosyltransferase